MFTIKDIDFSVFKYLYNPKTDNTNKSDNGRLMILGGSSLYRGSVSLSVKAALRTGVGIAELLSVERVIASLAAKIDEPIYNPLHHDEENVSISYDSYNKSTILKSSRAATAVLIGPGLSISESTTSLLRDFIYSYSVLNKPVVFDADALNILAKHDSFMAKITSSFIFTPHVLEMARLCDVTKETFLSNSLEYTGNYSKKHKVIVVLKDYITNIFNPEDSIIYRYNSPNGGLSKGGSGDVLSGAISSFMAQGYSPIDSCVMGVLLNGEAAKIAASDLTKTYMLPGDIINYYKDIFKVCES